jgi:alcohol dehydrogenase class IV
MAVMKDSVNGWNQNTAVSAALNSLSMQAFQFKTPGNIIFKAGSAGDPDTYRSLNINGNVLLVSDPILSKLGITEKVGQAIREAGSKVILFDQVEPEPKASSVRRLVEFASSENVNHVVGLGGGSPMDVAKIAALMIPSPQTVESMYGVGNARGKRLPLVLIPTTAGTGSEGTPVAVVTGDDGEKSPIVGPQFICDSVILDAVLTLGLPSGVTAATGADAMVHAIEAYTSAVRKNPVSDQLALQALQLLYGNISRVVERGEDLEAREKMLLGSMMAGLAFANASVGAVHALAYPLGTQFHLSHGESNAIVLVPVMRFNMNAAKPLYAEISRSVLTGSDTLDEDDAAALLINKLAELIPGIGLRDRLSQYGIKEKDLDSLTEGCLKQERLLSYNIRPMNQEDIFSTFQSVLN